MIFLPPQMWTMMGLAMSVLAVTNSPKATQPSPPLQPDDRVLRAEAQRIEMIERVVPSIVCLFDTHLRGGGSGVLIDPAGYGVTNYHVVAGLLDTRKGWGGLGDGVLYELEVLGIDVTGDVAMFRLIPPKTAYRFPSAKWGDSDAVRIGDTVFVMGNPFMLSEDYTPSVTSGIVTGTHRYQWGVRGQLVYTDCIQSDASINPGSSGGPMFNSDGEVIGINGRISVNTRGRYNVGFGYAITSNQIKRFIPTLRAGMLALHGTWQAQVEAMPDGGVVFAEVRDPGPTWTAGVRRGDTLLALDGRPIETINQVISMLGTYPADWPVLLTTERAGVQQGTTVRLEPVKPKMKKPFSMDAAVNRREVRRVLSAYRKSSLAHHVGTVPRTWRWNVTRRHYPTADGSVKAMERFEAVHEEEGPVRLHQRLDDGAAGRVIVYDDSSATQRSRDGEKAYDVPPDEKMILQVLYRMQQWLRLPVEEMDLADVAHVGADAIIQPSVEPRLLEVIQWPLAGNAVARFAFDAESFLLRRIHLHDRLSGSRVTIKLSDHHDLGGFVWPLTMEVTGKGYAYRDTLSNGVLSP